MEGRDRERADLLGLAVSVYQHPGGGRGPKDRQSVHLPRWLLRQSWVCAIGVFPAIPRGSLGVGVIQATVE